MESLKKKIEGMGWSVSDCPIGPDFAPGWEISQYSPAGEDFSFAIEHGNDPERAVKEIGEYAIWYDVEEHVAMWINARNHTSGVPDADTLVNDAKAIRKMLAALYDHISGTDSGVPDVNAPCRMLAGDLKTFLKDVPDDAPVYVACQGYSNYDFKNNSQVEETFAVLHEGKLIIMDECAVDNGFGGTI